MRYLKIIITISSKFYQITKTITQLRNLLIERHDAEHTTRLNTRQLVRQGLVVERQHEEVGDSVIGVVAPQHSTLLGEHDGVTILQVGLSFRSHLSAHTFMS